jgi:phosphohistidine phosphatase
MIVYFLRHSSAGQHKLSPKQDEKRPLDDVGERQACDIGRALAALGVEVEAIVSSPLTRAMQTAEIAAKEFGHKDNVVAHGAMRPEADYDQFHELLAQYGNRKAILVVGHNPSITEFLLHLLCGSETCNCIEFKKGAVAKVEIEDGKVTLQWMMTPKLASKLQAAASTRSSRPKTSRK